MSAESAGGSSAESAAAVDGDAAPLVPALPDALKMASVDPGKVDEFISLLASCNVHTRGALLLFAPELQDLVNMMYATDTPLGKMQAKGFVASLRVRARLRPHPWHTLPLHPHIQVNGCWLLLRTSVLFLRRVHTEFLWPHRLANRRSHRLQAAQARPAAVYASFCRM